MRTVGLILGLVLALTAPASLRAGSPAQGKAFVDAYRKALETKDTKALASFLYTTGADPTVLDFYRTMQAADAGKKVLSIELVDLTPAEAKDAAALKDGPSGKLRLPLVPIKKLVVKAGTADANGSSTGTSESFVAESDGKLVIPVPAPAK